MEAVGLAVESQERFLGGVERCFAISHHAHRDRENATFVGAHQFIEGFLVSPNESIEKLDVVRHAENRTS